MQATKEPKTVDIVLHKQAMSAEDAAPYLRDIGIDPNTADVTQRKIRVEVTPEALERLKNWESVKQIEEVRLMFPHNNLARNDVYINSIPAATSNAGKDQVVAVNDSGFDRGTKVHPAFTGRIKGILAVSRPKIKDDPNSNALTNDPSGHGTHVCGSVAGSGSSSTMGGTSGNIQGTAPSASLVVSSLYNTGVDPRDGKIKDFIDYGSDLYQLFVPTYGYEYGARIATNSWGRSSIPRQLDYDISATKVDGFAWDHKDHVILFSAGNDKDDPERPPHQIGATAAAKNIITVGATLSSRPNDGYDYVPTNVASNPRDPAPYSSIGPVIGGRMKPDVVAPGTAILSVCSRDPAITEAMRQRGGPTKDDDWVFKSGTSMATPLVAGCCAALRQAVIAAGVGNPSAALIKALLINGALASGETHESAASAESKPDGENGFGFVDISRSFLGVDSSLMRDEQSGLNTKPPNNTRNHNIASSPSTTKPGLKVTLVWTDRAASSGAIQNKLVLSMKDKAGVVKNDGQEKENNVQQIIVHKPTYPVDLTVTCTKITDSDLQPYALVWQFIE